MSIEWIGAGIAALLVVYAVWRTYFGKKKGKTLDEVTEDIGEAAPWLPKSSILDRDKDR